MKVQFHSYDGYTFTGRSIRAEQFLWYILDCEDVGIPATKRSFLINMLGLDPTKVVFNGYLSNVFGAMGHAGLIKKTRVGQTTVYSYGPNAEAYLNGEFV